MNTSPDRPDRHRTAPMWAGVALTLLLGCTKDAFLWHAQSLSDLIAITAAGAMLDVAVCLSVALVVMSFRRDRRRHGWRLPMMAQHGLALCLCAPGAIEITILIAAVALIWSALVVRTATGAVGYLLPPATGLRTILATLVEDVGRLLPPLLRAHLEAIRPQVVARVAWPVEADVPRLLQAIPRLTPSRAPPGCAHS